ncbi:hypothetical protein H0H81_002270 [Sphagnurus paluster]|uniref:Uncharacterized protein n=1 Tax=Sphagnurus paluster TaxID=117069 RepID=A0A9P7FZJ7_9AGAR|nr:hypothetical protein H0H81_002270 [Sphagnurus paluster]
MDTSEPDQWSLGGNPSSITSFFKLPFVNGSSDKLIESPICTANCGLGWRFIIISTITPGELGTQQTKFQISFDQHSIAASKDLVLSSAIISFEKLVGPAQDTFPLSTRRPISRPVFLAEYSSLENFTGIATIQIKIKFNPSFTLTPSVPLATPKLQKVLESSLTGQDLGNTRFYLFTRRASKNVAFGPQLLFANSSLLEGHSETLGKLLDGKTPEAVKIVGQQLPSIREGSYDYDSDSDMESDHEDNDAENRKVDRSGIKFKRPGQPMTNSVSQNIAAHMDDSQVLFIPDISFTTYVYSSFAQSPA